MILEALNRYYDILCQDASTNIAPYGYSTTGVSFALGLSPGGELLNIFPLFHQVQMGRNLVERPRHMIVPEQLKRSGIAPPPNFLCDNSAYVLGLTEKGADDPDYGRRRFTSFRDFHQILLTGLECVPARAILAFLATYDPEKGKSNPVILPHLPALLKGGNLVFMINDTYAQDDPAIRSAWEKYIAGKDAVSGQCLVTGEIAPIARLHPSLKGVRDANPTGASLVGFNDRAYESYNKTKLQGLNSPVSQKATFAYTTALNYLLSSDNPNRKLTIGDTTVVYWAESKNQAYAEAFGNIFEPPLMEEPTGEMSKQPGRSEKSLGEVAGKIRRVQKLDLDALLKDLQDEDPRFYVLGLAPNAARVSVRFFLTDPFQKMVGRLMQHYHDLEIIKEFPDQPGYITVNQMLRETVSRKARDQEPVPLMSGAVLRAILTGSPYPASLFYSLINRIRADMDDKSKNIRKINYPRAAIIKAFLIRKYKHHDKYKEVLGMSLNEQATAPAYVLGRLFAVLERAQQDAVGEINAGIKDRYFTSACASPASVFPVLLRLSQHHISKVKHETGPRRNYDRRIQEILDLLDVEENPIPSRLSLDEQGVFILGYYHQRAAFYAKSAASLESSISETN